MDRVPTSALMWPQRADLDERRAPFAGHGARALERAVRVVRRGHQRRRKGQRRSRQRRKSAARRVERLALRSPAMRGIVDVGRRDEERTRDEVPCGDSPPACATAATPRLWATSTGGRARFGNRCDDAPTHASLSGLNQSVLLDAARGLEVALPARLPVVGARARPAGNDQDFCVGGPHGLSTRLGARCAGSPTGYSTPPR